MSGRTAIFVSRLCIIGFAIGLVTACSPAEQSFEQPADATELSVFHRGNGGEPDTLDPHRNEENSGAAVVRDLFEGLLTEKVDASIEPGVAREWTISADGLVYTFSLRDDARWSNGDAVTADDFVAGMRRTVDPETASSYAQILLPIKNAGAIIRGEMPVEALGINAVGDLTLEIKLEAPTAYFLQLLTHSTTYPLHRPSFAEYGDQFSRPGRLVSNGAYRLTEWVVNSHIRLEKNDFYYRADEVGIDVVYYHSTENLESELARYRAGELDYTFQIPNSRFDWIQEHLEGELYIEPYLSTYFYGFDTTEPPFDDARIRQALSMAVDRRIITKEVNGLGEIPAYGLVPPGVAHYEQQSYAWRDLSDEARVARARELYAEAGYSEANPLRTSIVYNTSENHRRLAVAIASMWKETLGVETSVRNEEWKVMLQTRQTPSRWDVMRYGWIGDYNDAYTFLEIFESGHGQNFTGFSDKRFDDLSAMASRETDLEARAGIMAEAEARLLDSYAILPIYFYVSKHLVKPYVRGFQPNILDHNLSRHYSLEHR
jgi:oligopeptide transport system substrate-binding protein